MLLAKGGDDSGSSGSGRNDSDDDDDSDSKSSSSGNSGSSGSGSSPSTSGSGDGEKRERIKTSGIGGPVTTPTKTPVTVRQDEEKETEKIEVEIRSVKTGVENTVVSQLTAKPVTSLRVRTEVSKQEIVLKTATTKIKIETEGDKVRIKAEQENEDEVELEDEALEEVNKALEEEAITVGTDSAKRLVIERKNVEAQTHFPLSIDLATKSLIVTTPAGVKTVTVLPDAAVANLIDKRIITDVVNASDSAATLPFGASRIELKDLDNKLVFEVKGIRKKKLLGLLPVSIAKTAFVSAENGDLVQVNESVFNRFLDALSF